MPVDMQDLLDAARAYKPPDKSALTEVPYEDNPQGKLIPVGRDVANAATPTPTATPDMATLLEAAKNWEPQAPVYPSSAPVSPAAVAPQQDTSSSLMMVPPSQLPPTSIAPMSHTISSGGQLPTPEPTPAAPQQTPWQQFIPFYGEAYRYQNPLPQDINPEAGIKPIATDVAASLTRGIPENILGGFAGGPVGVAGVSGLEALDQAAYSEKVRRTRIEQQTGVTQSGPAEGNFLTSMMPVPDSLLKQPYVQDSLIGLGILPETVKTATGETLTSDTLFRRSMRALRVPTAAVLGGVGGEVAQATLRRLTSKTMSRLSAGLANIGFGAVTAPFQSVQWNLGSGDPLSATGLITSGLAGAVGGAAGNVIGKAVEGIAPKIHAPIEPKIETTAGTVPVGGGDVPIESKTLTHTGPNDTIEGMRKAALREGLTTVVSPIDEQNSRITISKIAKQTPAATTPTKEPAPKQKVGSYEKKPKAVLVPFGTTEAGNAGYTWETPGEKSLSGDFKTYEEAIANAPQGYEHVHTDMLPIPELDTQRQQALSQSTRFALRGGVFEQKWDMPDATGKHTNKSLPTIAITMSESTPEMRARIDKDAVSSLFPSVKPSEIEAIKVYAPGDVFPGSFKVAFSSKEAAQRAVNDAQSFVTNPKGTENASSQQETAAIHGNGLDTGGAQETQGGGPQGPAGQGGEGIPPRQIEPPPEEKGLQKPPTIFMDMNFPPEAKPGVPFDANAAALKANDKMDKAIADAQVPIAEKIAKLVRGAKRLMWGGETNVRGVLEKIDRQHEIMYNDAPAANGMSFVANSVATNEVLRELTLEEKKIAGKVLNAYRIGSILDYRPDYKDHYFGSAENGKQTAKAFVDNYVKNFGLSVEQGAKIDNAMFGILNLIRAGTLDHLYANGVINFKEYTRLSEKGAFYVPRHEIKPDSGWVESIDPTATIVIAGKRYDVTSSGLKPLEDSASAVETDITKVVPDVLTRTAALVRKNNMIRQAYEIAANHPDNGAFSTYPRKGYVKANFQVLSETHSVYVHPDIALDYLRIGSNITQKHLALKLWDTMISMVKAPITGPLHPAMAFPDAIRNWQQAYWASEAQSLKKLYSADQGLFTAQYMTDMVQTAKDALTHTGAWQDFMNEAHFITMNDERRALLLSNSRIKRNLGAASDFFSWMSNTGEIWSRLAVRNRAIKSGVSPEEASFIAKSYLDYSKSGAIPQTLERAGLLYTNASMQALYGVAAAANRNPARFTAKMVDTIAWLTAGYMLMYWNQDKHNPGKRYYDQQSDLNKVNYFSAPIGPDLVDKKGNKRVMTFKTRTDGPIGVDNAIAQVIAGSIYNSPWMESMTGIKGNVRPLSNSAIATALANGFSNLPSVGGDLFIRLLGGMLMNKDYFTGRDLTQGINQSLPPSQQALSVAEANKPGVTGEPTRLPYVEALGNPTVAPLADMAHISPVKAQFMFDTLLGRSEFFDIAGATLDKMLANVPADQRQQTWSDILANAPSTRSFLGQTDPRYLYSIQQNDSAEAERQKKALELQQFSKLAGTWFQTQNAHDFNMLKGFVRSADPEDKKGYFSRVRDLVDWARKWDRSYVTLGDNVRIPVKQGSPIVDKNRIPFWLSVKSEDSKDASLARITQAYKGTPVSERNDFKTEFLYIYRSPIYRLIRRDFMKDSKAIDAGH